IFSVQLDEDKLKERIESLFNTSSIQKKIKIEEDNCNLDKNNCIGLLTGPIFSTNYIIGKELSTSIAVSGVNNINILSKVTKGTKDNYNTMNSGENAAFGIFQADIIKELLINNKTREFNTKNKTSIICQLYTSEFHIFCYITILIVIFRIIIIITI
ncbi:hypothetical protein MHK_007255, partial [Candidatus Magnetomorum sp. HK-1]